MKRVLVIILGPLFAVMMIGCGSSKQALQAPAQPQNPSAQLAITSISGVAVDPQATTTAPRATVATPYAQTFAASGGAQPYTWSVTSGALPPGLTLSQGGLLGGAATTAGSYTFTVQVSDTASTKAAASVSLPVVSPLSVTTVTLPSGTVGTAYQQTLAASGGVSPYTWSVATGSLPAGIALDAQGVLSGTPTASGSTAFSVGVKDATATTKTSNLTLNIAQKVSNLSIDTTTVPTGVAGRAYQTAFAASGGTAPYSWTLASGTVPAGLVLAANGTLSGTPTKVGASTFTVQVAEAGFATKTATFTLTVNSGLAIATTSLPAATIGYAYRQDLSATGGVAPYTWSITQGTLPAGITMLSSGTVSGMATATESARFTVQVSDAAGGTKTTAMSMDSGPFQYVLGTTHYPYSTQPKPATKGATFFDAVYHMPVKRVTTTAADSGSFGTITEYPTFDPSSADGQYVIFQDCGSLTAYQNANCGGYVLYDGVNFQYLRDLSATLQSPLLGWDSNEPEPRWNRGPGQDPHAFSYRKHMQLREYNAVSQSDVLIHDFCKEFGPSGTLARLNPCATDGVQGYFVFMHEYGSPSTDSRYYAFYIKNSAAPYDNPYAFVYDRVLDKVVGLKDIGSAPAGMLGVHMSPSGNYVMVNYFCDSAAHLSSLERCGVTAYTRDFSSYVKVSNYPDHMGYAWTKQGHEVIVMASSGTDQVEFTRLDTGQTYQIASAASMDYPSILYTYQNNPGWIFAGTYGGSFNNPVWSNESDAGPGQIFAFELDETKCDQWFDSYVGSPSAAYGGTNPHTCATSNQRIWRIAFTQNIYQGPSPYFMQVNPQINFAGTKLWFGSNWRSSSSAPEVYQVDLPANWVNDLANLP